MNRRVVLPRVVHEDVNGVLGEEELMRGVVDLLPAEVPDVEPARPAIDEIESGREDVDAARGLVLTRQRRGRLVESPQQTRLAGAALADDEDLRLV